ncbi:uncharacterized protein LOC126870747 isoform X1 [Bombus huntii]|uniref:uncharacterized protein LOC126870747 isoform X1 n=1 Tax=Bombus huntii TaxID=85661 RepID=UPI0021AAA9F0|nr:uncharacterized protein LOC126870747 isoform X1 [Bombus huntii]XP_050484732.1 uncharacterized protein LOC126870747 isoform X1 [Bombus huntii]XP_050484733.1 uncharacterized protein LOC126870747 isoform X1 [Bombus huntii]
MGSTRQEDRLLGVGISLPQWIKGRTDNRCNFDDITFSPPSHDDSFFYIRYPKTQNRSSVSQEYRPIDEVFEEQNITSSTNNVKVQDTQQQQFTEEKKKYQEIDFSKHPLPCQPFIPSTLTANKEKGIKSSPKVLLADNTKITKSQGVDDGFHGKPALCGKSIVLVANQMMSNKLHETVSAEQAASQPRRGSKSLPATPVASPSGSPSGSPKARRRVSSNRYFAGASLHDCGKYQGGWILASIFGQSRELVTSKIEEEDEANIEVATAPLRSLARKKSISSQNLTYVGSDEKSEKSAAYPNAFRAKPSQLREMNFWSPTSM